MTIAEQHPAAHNKYLVLRGVTYFTATPCYGMHAPWWVVRIMGKRFEAEPEPMEDTDQWWHVDKVNIEEGKK